MRYLSALALVLGLSMPALGEAPRTPTRLMLMAEGRCSAVVVGPRKAYTAWHCVQGHSHLRVDSIPVTGLRLAEDLAQLVPVKGRTFAGPYAHVGGSPPQDLVLEGYGCHASRDWIGSYKDLHVETRVGTLVGVTAAYPGMEIWIMGRVCPGDSGGAVYANQGDLVGVITAASSDEGLRLAFATPVPAPAPAPVSVLGPVTDPID